MGKKGGSKGGSNLAVGSNSRMTLREEIRGIKQKKGVSGNAKTNLKLEHLRSLATWASGEASMPSLGAFFGYRLASVTEANGTAVDASLFTCRRCETVLQPGFNCKVRIEKSSKKVRSRNKKPNISTQNNVVYKCNYCLQQNLKRGTPKGHMKEICAPKAKKTSVPKKPLPRKSASLDGVARTEVGVMDKEIEPLEMQLSVPKKSQPRMSSSKAGTRTEVGANEVKEIDHGAISIEELQLDKAARTEVEANQVREIDRGAIAIEALQLEEAARSEVGATEVKERDPATIAIDELQLDEVAGTEVGSTEDHEIDPPATTVEQLPSANSPATPLLRTTLLEGKKRKRKKPEPKKQAEAESSSAPGDVEKTVGLSRRKRKGWTSLKEMAKSREHKDMPNLTVPFVL